MPSKNTRKVYIKNAYYHVYNRGVNKRSIFVDERDYKVFLKYLKEYLSPKQKHSDLNKVTFTLQGQAFKAVPRQPNNYSKEIELVAYCLMPNHYHLLVKQNNNNSMKNFLHSIIVRYSMYFNKRHNRVGPLFQGRYKAALITTDPYLLHLTRYIHLNPLDYTNNLTEAYSSYADYLGLRNTKWVKPDKVLKFFNTKTIPEITKVNSYKDFVEDNDIDSSEVLGKLVLE